MWRKDDGLAMAPRCGSERGKADRLDVGGSFPPFAREVPLRDLRRRYAAQRRRTSEALVPPKPNEFERATLISRFWALCGTRSMAVSTEGLSRFRVGGA